MTAELIDIMLAKIENIPNLIDGISSITLYVEDGSQWVCAGTKLDKIDANKLDILARIKSDRHKYWRETNSKESYCYISEHIPVAACVTIVSPKNAKMLAIAEALKSCANQADESYRANYHHLTGLRNRDAFQLYFRNILEKFAPPLRLVQQTWLLGRSKGVPQSPWLALT